MTIGRHVNVLLTFSDSFKEQLKSDEASKNKAEKKAKKEMEEERNKPVRYLGIINPCTFTEFSCRFALQLAQQIWLRPQLGMPLVLFTLINPRPRRVHLLPGEYNKPETSS